jgi:hypothetical protein
MFDSVFNTSEPFPSAVYERGEQKQQSGYSGGVDKLQTGNKLVCN